MRFGIMAMQLDMLVPAGLLPEKLMAHVAGFDHAGLVNSLAEIHLHDAPWQGPEGKLGYGQDHRPLGTGDLDTSRLLERLQKAGFARPLVFELRLEEALASMEYLRTLCPDLL
jgi:sugar phosphate isomerase/epimerase